MTLDWDGKIRMDCSSPSAMASLIGLREGAEYDIATGNDADADRHGIVTPDAGLMNPNHYLAVAIGYLFGGARPDWPDAARIGKTLVSSSMIDRVAASLGRADGRGAGRLQVVRARPDRRVVRLRRRGVGGRVVPAPRRLRLDHRQGRHHPGAAGLGDPGHDRARRRPSTTPTWSPSTATRRTPASTRRPTAPRRRSSPPSPPTTSRPPSLAGEEITARLTAAPGNGAKIGGLKVTTAERLVRRPPLRHRGRLQDLRRVLPRRRPPRPGPGRGPGRGVRRPPLSWG